MKNATIFDNNGNFIRKIDTRTYKNLTSEEQKNVFCGHKNAAGEVCKGPVSLIERMLPDGTRTEYYSSNQHIPGCLAYTPGRKKGVMLEHDPDGRDVDLERVFRRLTEMSHHDGQPPRGPGGNGGHGGEPKNREPESFEIIEKRNINPDLEALVGILRRKRTNGIYAGRYVYDLLIDEFTFSEHSVGWVPDEMAIVLGVVDYVWYRTVPYNIKLRIQRSSGPVEAYVYLEFEDVKFFTQFKRALFSSEKKLIRAPMAAVGTVTVGPQENGIPTFCLSIKNNRAAALISESVFKSHHDDLD